MRHLHSQRQVPSQTPVQKTRIQKATAQRRKVFSCFIRPSTHTNLTWKRYKPSQGWKKQEREQPRPQQWSISIDKVGLTILMNGKPLSIPIVAANVVLPLQASKKHVTVYMLLLNYAETENHCHLLWLHEASQTSRNVSSHMDICNLLIMKDEGRRKHIWSMTLSLMLQAFSEQKHQHRTHSNCP